MKAQSFRGTPSLALDCLTEAKPYLKEALTWYWYAPIFNLPKQSSKVYLWFSCLTRSPMGTLIHKLAKRKIEIWGCPFFRDHARLTNGNAVKNSGRIFNWVDNIELYAYWASMGCPHLGGQLERDNPLAIAVFTLTLFKINWKQWISPHARGDQNMHDRSWPV